MCDHLGDSVVADRARRGAAGVAQGRLPRSKHACRPCGVRGRQEVLETGGTAAARLEGQRARGRYKGRWCP